MPTDMHANVLMEEGYMRVTVEYTQLKYRSVICDAIGEVETELEVYPEVLHRRKNDSSGTFSVEFSGDDYICSRTSGEFIEMILKKLNIKKCDS